MRLRVGEQRQVRHEPVRVGGDSVEQHQQVPRQPPHGGAVEQRGVVSQFHGKPQARNGHQAQRVVGRLDGRKLPQPQAVRGGGLVVDRVVLEDDDAVEQVPTCPGLQLRQRYVLEAPRLDLGRLERAQPVGGAGRVADGDPDRQGVDEDAGHLVHAGQVGRPAGYRRAEAHVGPAAVARQQQRPGALHDRVDGESVALGHLAQPVERVGVQRERQPPRRTAAVRLRGCPVVGQRGSRVESGQRPPPVRLSWGGVGAFEPLQVVPEGVPVRQRETGVGGEHVRQHLEHAPPVEQDVMERPDDPHLVGGQPGDGQSQQGWGVEVEAGGAVGGEQPVEFGLAFGLVQAGPVEVGDRQRHTPVDELQRFGDAFPDHAATQDRCAVHDPLPRGPERPRVGHPVQEERRLLEVHALVGLGQPVEDHPGLHGGEGVDVLDATAVADQPVHCGLVEVGEREVRRGTPTGADLGAVRHDLAQRGDRLVGEPPHRRLVVHLVGVVPGDLQRVVFDPADHVEQMTAGLVRMGVGGKPPTGAGDQPTAGGAGVELTQVVDTHRRRRLT